MKRRYGKLKEIQPLNKLLLSDPVAGKVVLQDVVFSYAKGEKLLSGINLTIAPQHIAVVSGESGLGKTTMLNIAASLLKAESGKVVRPANLGVVFQDDRFLPWRDLLWNTAMPLIYRGYSRNKAIGLARYLLAEVGLGGNESLVPDELSGGMKKRLAFARCFTALPEAIFMDEPFTGLHRKARMDLWRIFFDLLHLRPVPVLVITHLPEEIPERERCLFYTLAGKPAVLSAV